MNIDTAAPPSRTLSLSRFRTDPTYQAFWTLRIGFTVAPILFGIDKFANILTQWDHYLAPRLDRLISGSAHWLWPDSP